ncbi:glycosyltransferase family 9 protein [Cellulophaga omnivescoria]|uniref:glycosyltransferase family 9 protein n=1 Tax=Cellulophaga omnivescoria TaxID=1888890 RepID=UPI000987334E|nr:glycosyltransferase family 9 protein [Cellulophaga omnivescoria]
MGDVAMTVPVVKGLLIQNPDLKITILTRRFFTPMFAQLPNVQVYEADVKGKHKGVNGLYKLFKELKALKITAVADIHNVLRSNILKQFFKLSGIPFIQIDKGRADKKALTASKNKVFKQLKTTQQRYVSVFSKLGFPIKLDESCALTKEKLSDTAIALLPKEPKKWIGIAPFAAFEGKTYPLELMEQVVSSLNTTNAYTVILFGGGDKEKEVLDSWEQTYSNCVSVVKKLRFTEELSLISNLDVMLAMDSGNAHLSAMFAVPTITLWGVTHPFAGFYPFAQQSTNALLANRENYPLIPTSVYGNKFPPGYEKAMKTILPDDVVQKVLEVVG